MRNYLYVVDVSKYDSKKTLESLYIVSPNILFALEIARHLIFDLHRYPNKIVEIMGIRRELSVPDVANVHFEENMDVHTATNDNPFELEGVDEEHIITFKHDCGEQISVLDNGWTSIVCPSNSCNKIIYRDELDVVAGIWVYIPREHGNER